MPDKAKFLALVQAQQQRAQRNRRGASCGPASDHGIEGLGDLQLHPVHAAIGNVRAVGPLRDNPFQAGLSRKLEELFSMLQLMIGVANPLRRVQQTLQQLLALQERRFAEIITVAIEKIESEV